MPPIEPTLAQLTTLFKLHTQDRADRSLATLRQCTGAAPDPSPSLAGLPETPDRGLV